MMKSYFLFVAFIVSLLLIGCADEPYRIEDSVCGKFLTSHPDIVKDYKYISCFDSTHVVYQLNRMYNKAILAKVQENGIVKQQIIEYLKFERKVVFTDIDTSKEDSSARGTDGLFKGIFSIARKNDSTFYVFESTFEATNKIMLFSRDGKKIKDLLTYTPVTSCHESPLVYNMRPIGTDSTFSLKFSYDREEENKEYEGFVSLDLKNDSLSYGSQDSLTQFLITRYKVNGDSVLIAPKFEEVNLEKSNRKKCIGHFF